METKDIEYMNRAIALARKGTGWVNPNPLVGAVLVKDGRIIGEGWHERCGGLHAERNAFRNCRESAEGATLYVTLEPCCHYGKTPPCTEAVIENRIARVVVGLTDPNPLVAGKGIAQLRAAGIEVVAGVEEAAIRDLNRVFLKYITTGLPWVVLKTAMTLDGKIAAYTGDSKWVTGEAARHRVQEMRSEHMAIMAGIGTVRADDPLLNCRLEGDVRQPSGWIRNWCVQPGCTGRSWLIFPMRMPDVYRRWTLSGRSCWFAGRKPDGWTWATCCDNWERRG